MTYVRPNIYINKQTSPIFNCVTPVSVSLATLARQLGPTQAEHHLQLGSQLFFVCVTT